MVCALGYGNGKGTTPLQPPSECQIFAYPSYSDPCLGGWIIVRVMWPHPLLPGAAQALSSSILDVNPPWHVPWCMATAPVHFNHPQYITLLHTQATVTLIDCSSQVSSLIKKILSCGLSHTLYDLEKLSYSCR